MSEAPLLTAADLRFVNLVAARRFGGRAPIEPDDLDGALRSVTGATPPQRAAAIAGALLGRRVFEVAPLPTALLAMTAQLDREGLQLLAPQGATVGMVRELALGSGDVAVVARWLEDRSVPASSEA